MVFNNILNKKCNNVWSGKDVKRTNECTITTVERIKEFLTNYLISFDRQLSIITVFIVIFNGYIELINTFPL